MKTPLLSPLVESVTWLKEWQETHEKPFTGEKALRRGSELARRRQVSGVSSVVSQTYIERLIWRGRLRGDDGSAPGLAVRTFFLRERAMTKRYEEILWSGYSREMRRSGLLPYQGEQSPTQVEGIFQAVFPQPDGDRNFWPSETRSEFSHSPWGWTLGWGGTLRPGGWNGPGPTGRALNESLYLYVRLPHDIPPGEFDPVGEYILDSSDEEAPAFANYGVTHDLSEYGFTRAVRFEVPKGWIRVTRLGNGNLAGQFEVTVPLSPIRPAPFEPVGTPDYEPPEFILVTKNGAFLFPPAPIPANS